MHSKKIFLWPVLISLVGHVVLITVSGMIDLRHNVRAEEIFNVQIADIIETRDPGVKDDQPPPPPPPEEQTFSEETQREDTVDLGNPDIKYAQYLSTFKRRVQRIWVYPPAAFERGEEGDAVVKISLNADGKLHQVTLVSSSGSTHLDSGTLAVVQAAAPFAPLPSGYNLTRLHIIASFRYRMTP